MTTILSVNDIEVCYGQITALHGITLAGCDVVEVAPAYDSPGQPTALLGATIAWEAISLHARARAALAETTP